MDVEAIPLDEVSMERLCKFPSPRITKSRIGTKSLCMDQMTLLEKIDKKRLKDNPTDDQDCYAHECAHCKTLLTSPGKRMGDYVLGQLLYQGRTTLCVHKDILTNGVILKDELQLPSAHKKNQNQRRT